VSLHSVTVSWESKEGYAKPIANNKIYPEKPTPTGNVENQLYLKCNISPAIPQGRTGTVHYKILDPKNDLTGTTADMQDNNGLIDKLSSTFNFTQNESSKKEILTITKAQPGDNYIAVVYPCSKTRIAITGDDKINYAGSVTTTQDPFGGTIETPIYDTPVSNNYLTGKLTVWRTLNMEMDRMQNCGDFSTSLLVAEMGKLCIDIKKLDAYSKEVTVTIDIATLVVGGNQDCPTNSSPNFWYIHTYVADHMILNQYVDVMTITRTNGIVTNIIKTKVLISNNDYALGVNVNSVVFVFNKTIDKYAGTQHPAHKVINDGQPPVPYIYPDTATIKKDTLLHETIHSFRIADNEKVNGSVIFDIMCYTYCSKTDPPPIIEIMHHVKTIQSTLFPMPLPPP
jgi:hypothetical protein